MTELITLLANFVVGLLLVAVIIYCRRLNRSIKVLQDSKSELAQMFKEFDESIAKASESVDELQESAKKTDAILKEKLEKANMIADDLSFMIDRGNKTADKLEGALDKGRGDTPAAPASKAKGSPVGNPDHLSALTKKDAPAAKTEKADEPKSGNTGRTASIESVLEQIANRNNPQAKGQKDTGGGGRKTNSRVRSKAEQELFDSLKSDR